MSKSDIVKYMKRLRCKLMLLRKKNIHLGSNSSFGRGTVLYAPKEMNIGNNVYIGKYCSLEADINIGNNVWIGKNVCIMSGVSIGDNTVIGANSVVTHSLPSNCMACGAPAKIIKQL